MDRRTCVGWIIQVGLLLAGAPAAAAIGDYPFRIVTQGTSAQYQVVAENNGPAPITVHVEAGWEHVTSDHHWPITAVVPPYASVPLARILPDQGAAAAHNASFRYSYHFGRLDAAQDERIAYRLPFEDGRGFEVSQAYGGRLTTHDNDATQYAIDFAMPAGSAVVAARDGVVIDVTLRYTEGGRDPRLVERANTVAVAHDDGTVAEYAHLSPGPALVQAGERVRAGDLLGYSGSTGYSSEPHLHFIVTRPVLSAGRIIRVSLPVQFYSGDTAARFSAQMGTILHANYGSGTRFAAARPDQARRP